MQNKAENFQVLKAIDFMTVFFLVLFLALFMKTIFAVVNALQSEVYTNLVAGLDYL
jgi:hypothetical protein